MDWSTLAKFVIWGVELLAQHAPDVLFQHANSSAALKKLALQMGAAEGTKTQTTLAREEAERNERGGT